VHRPQLRRRVPFGEQRFALPGEDLAEPEVVRDARQRRRIGVETDRAERRASALPVAADELFRQVRRLRGGPASSQKHHISQ